MDSSLVQLNSFDNALLLHLDIDKLIALSNLFSNGFIVVMKKYKAMSSSIFSCYEFIDNKENGILYNKDTEETYFVSMLKLIKDKQNSSLNEIIQSINYCIKATQCSNEEKFTSLLMLLYLFLKENVWGPSFTFIKETEKIDHSHEIEKITLNYFNILTISKEVNNEILNVLSVSGEEIYKHSKILLFYYMPFHFIHKEKLFKGKLAIESLWNIRLLNILNKLIIEPVDSIQKDINDFYKNSFDIDKISFEDNKTKGLLLIERSFYHMKYHQYNNCANEIDKAKDSMGIDISLTGKMGRKTKFQDFDTPVLVVSVDSNKDTKLHQESSSLGNEEGDSYLNKLTLEEDNPLLEKPKLTNEEEEKHFSSQVISIYDQIYIIAYLNYLRRSLPDEELKREVILSYSEKVLGKSFDWLVYSKLLYHRSIAEKKITKKIERALLQIESLCNQYSDRSPIPYERQKLFWVIDYFMIFDIKKQYAETFMSFGAVKTACDIFKELHMWEETIQCLYISNNRTESKDLAMKVLSEYEDPGIYCILGELENNVDYFNKALQVAKRSYPRAYRCLGRYYLCQNEDDKAIEYYEKAMELNPVYPDIWFKLGCLYLKKKQIEKAAGCFSKILSLDDSGSEVWGNLGVCFIQLKKYKEAMKCFEEGFSCSRKNWKLLDNLIYVSVECGEIHKIIFAIENMYLLDEIETVKPGYFYHLIKLFLSNYSQYSEHDKDFLEKKINSLFGIFMMKDGNNPDVWDFYSLFIEGTKGKNEQSANEIIEILLKELRGLVLKPLWEKDEVKRKRIEKVIAKGKELLVEIKSKEKEDFVKDKYMFFNGIISKLEIEKNKESLPKEFQ